MPPALATNSHLISISCISCRQRKVKCNKVQPCSACQRSAIDCIFPQHVRRPRGRQGGSKSRSDELAHRLNRLEGLVERFGAEHAVATSSRSSRIADEDPAAFVGVADQRSRNLDLLGMSNDPWESGNYKPVVKADGSRYLSGDFWTSLSDEVGHLIPHCPYTSCPWPFKLC